MSDVGEGVTGSAESVWGVGGGGMVTMKVVADGGVKMRMGGEPGGEAHLSFHSCNPSNLDY